MTHDPRIPTPPELSPLWSKFLLYGRDLLLLPTTAMRFLMLSKENFGRSKLPFNFVFSFSMAYFLVFSLLFLWAGTVPGTHTHPHLWQYVSQISFQAKESGMTQELQNFQKHDIDHNTCCSLLVTKCTYLQSDVFL